MDSCLSQCDKVKSSESKFQRLYCFCIFLPIYEKLPDQALRKRYLKSAFAELSSALDPLSSRVSMYRQSIAELLWKSGDKAAALGMFQQLVAKYDGDVPDRAYALIDQADFFNRKNMAEEAERSLREALRIRSRLYDSNDRRVVQFKIVLANILEARKQTKEAAAIRDSIQIPAATADYDVVYELTRSYQDAGQLEKAIAIDDVCIRKLFEIDPDQSSQERNFMLRHAIELCEKAHDDKRLEHYLNEAYISEKKRLGFANQSKLIRFNLNRNRLTIAEKLANQDVAACRPMERNASSQESLAYSFLLLAQVKNAEQRHDTAKYYVRRAIQAVEPYGRSAVHIVAVGQLAQILAKEGKTASAERLIEDLYFRELVDADGAVEGDIVDGFKTSGYYYNSGSPADFNRDDKQRYDTPFFVIPAGNNFYGRKQLPEQAPMIALNWTAPFITSYEIESLKASTLEARARLQTLQSKFKDADRSRSLMFDSIESSLDKPTQYPDFSNTEALLKQVPKSERQQQLLKRVQKLRNTFYD